MCRYAYNNYKPHYACFACRKTFKRRLLSDIEGRNEMQLKEAKCPQCGGLMANMGKDFKAPKKSEVKRWQYLSTLYSVGIAFHSCGCTGPGYIPNTPEALLNHLEGLKKEYLREFALCSNEVEPIEQKKIDWDITKPRPLTNKEAKDFWIRRLKEIDENLNKIQVN